MPKLVDLKLSKADKKETAPTPCGKYEGPDYPYGTTLRLDNTLLEKLGIKTLPKVGAEMNISAMGVVTSVSSHESQNRDDRNVEIQIQKLGLDAEDDEALDNIVGRRKA